MSGIIAALFSISPSLTAEQVLSVLKASAVDLGAPGWDQLFGWGRVDFGAAAWLAAVAGGSNPDLGRLHYEPTAAGLNMSLEYHRGMNYALMGKTNLYQVGWAEVAATPQTNGALMEFWVDPDADHSFFQIVGELDF